MIVLVTGGRKYLNFWLIWRTLDDLHNVHKFVKLVHGRGGNTDMSADAWAKQHGVPVKDYPAAWNDVLHPEAVVRKRRDGSEYNVVAGFWRNQQMIDEEDVGLVVAFPGGKGTADMVARARRAGIPVIEVSEDGQGSFELGAGPSR